MKKIMFAAAAAMLATSAMAVDVSVGGAYGDGVKSQTVTVGTTTGQVSPFVGLTHQTDQNKLSAGAGYELAKVGGVSFGPSLAVNRIMPTNGAESGYAVTAGVGASVALTKVVSVGVEAAYQRGQDRVKQFNGNTVGANVKFAF